MSDKLALVAVPTRFTLIEFYPRRPRSPGLLLRELNVERRSTNPESWAVTNMGSVLAKDGYWEHEPMPSSRDDEFLARCRWESSQEAIAFAQQHMNTYPSGYQPYEEEDVQEQPDAVDKP